MLNPSDDPQSTSEYVLIDLMEEVVIASDDDRRALKEALREVVSLAKAVELTTDTEATKGALWLVRGAAIDAYALCATIEDNTRNRALNELAARQ